MPAAASTKLILLPWAAAALLLLLLQEIRGGDCISLGGMEVRAGMEVEVAGEMDLLDSEVHRRLLWEVAGGRRYISYDALRGDVVPCSRPGVPYYNCRVTTTANPYTRGCESITRCRDVDP